MKFLFLFSLVLFSSAAQARPVTFDSGVAEEITISATIEQVANVSPEICAADPDSLGCEDVTFIPEQPHPCERRPDLRGCAFYKPEEKQ